SEGEPAVLHRAAGERGVRQRRLRHGACRSNRRRTQEVSDLAITRQDGVLRLHIDREAKRNALNGEVLRGMLSALQEPGDARVVLVSSAGEKVFCSGADLVAMAPNATGLEVHEGRGL